MKKFLPIICFGGLAAAVMLPVAAEADVKAGVDAWSIGNYDAAVQEWQPLAAHGDADAQFNLAQAYKLGRGVPRDIGKAQELYHKAAIQGHLEAADVYGLLLFQSGQRKEAMPYIQASAGRGDARAQYILGLAYFNGDLLQKDWVRAYALVSLANQAGLPQAANALTQMDQHISLADRQESITLSSQIAADAEATRAREMATADLASLHPAASPATQTTQATHAVAQAPHMAGTKETERNAPETSGADYTHTKPSSATSPKDAPKQTPANKPAVPSPAAKAAAPKVTAPTASGPWRIQLGAFGISGNAEALWGKLKSRPELSGHGKILVPAGKLTKLQAGGFASKAVADAACARLSAVGFSCLAVPD